MNEIKLNPDGPDEHGSFTHPQDCMCRDCLPGSNPLPTPNAGEKCPVCEGDGEIETMAGGWITCDARQGTGFKPSVESPAAEVKEREVVPKYQHPTTLIEFEAVYHLEYQRELDSSDKWINWCEKYKDTHGMNFNQGLKSSAIFHNCKMEQLLRVLKQEEPNINTKIAAKDSQIADLTTKLATLQVEKEKMLRTTTDAIINFVECQTKCDQFDTDLLKSTVLNEKLNYELTTLRAENQGLVNEVERLMEPLRYYADDATHKGAEYGYQWVKPVDVDLGYKAKKVLGMI